MNIPRSHLLHLPLTNLHQARNDWVKAQIWHNCTIAPAIPLIMNYAILLLGKITFSL